jgi:hypothetical protein
VLEIAIEFNDEKTGEIGAHSVPVGDTSVTLYDSFFTSTKPISNQQASRSNDRFPKRDEAGTMKCARRRPNCNCSIMETKRISMETTLEIEKSWGKVLQPAQ